MVSQTKPSRRNFIWGAAVTGAAATAVVALPKVQSPAGTGVSEPEPAKPERGGGYRLSEHVKQYYKTTLV